MININGPVSELESWQGMSFLEDESQMMTIAQLRGFTGRAG
jgi:hypothetical protein